MSHYRRNYVPGGTFFFTVVTHKRRPLFDDPAARSLLGSVMRNMQVKLPAEVVAIVLLPEHLHAIWTLPDGNKDYSVRWAWVKKEFTKRWLASGGSERPLTPSAGRERRRGIWQRRFWEHTVRDEDDLEAHFDYIHYNPVRHGLTKSPRDWPWSTFHRYVRCGH